MTEAVDKLEGRRLFSEMNGGENVDTEQEGQNSVDEGGFSFYETVFYSVDETDKNENSGQTYGKAVEQETEGSDDYPHGHYRHGQADGKHQDIVRNMKELDFQDLRKESFKFRLGEKLDDFYKTEHGKNKINDIKKQNQCTY